MVGLSFCDFVGNRQEKAMMAAYRQKEWPRRYKVRLLVPFKYPNILCAPLHQNEEIVFSYCVYNNEDGFDL